MMILKCQFCDTVDIVRNSKINEWTCQICKFKEESMKNKPLPCSECRTEGENTDLSGIYRNLIEIKECMKEGDEKGMAFLLGCVSEQVYNMIHR